MHTNHMDPDEAFPRTAVPGRLYRFIRSEHAKYKKPVCIKQMTKATGTDKSAASRALKLLQEGGFVSCEMGKSPNGFKKPTQWWKPSDK